MAEALDGGAVAAGATCGCQLVRPCRVGGPVGRGVAGCTVELVGPGEARMPMAPGGCCCSAPDAMDEVCHLGRVGYTPTPRSDSTWPLAAPLANQNRSWYSSDAQLDT